jgi:hypothetical protein
VCSSDLLNPFFLEALLWQKKKVGRNQQPEFPDMSTAWPAFTLMLREKIPT